MKKMKKLAALLMAVTMVLTSGMSVNAAADPATTPVLTIQNDGNGPLKAGDTVTLTISACAECVMSAFEFYAIWDETKFEFAMEPDEDGEYELFAESFKYTGGLSISRQTTENTVIWTGASIRVGTARVKEGQAIGVLTLRALNDVDVNELIATLQVKYITDDYAGVKYMIDMEEKTYLY